MRQIKFLQAAVLVQIELKESDISSLACKAALETFKTNIVRATGLLVIPGFASLTATAWATAQTQAQFELLGRMANHAELSEVIPKIHPRVQELTAQALGGTPENKQLLLAQMTDQFENFSRQSGPDYAVLLEGLLKSAIVQFWGSIEVMLGDLWEAVLNEHPIRLAGLHGKGTDEPSVKAISLAVLSENRYDISKKMGTILKGEFKFSTLDGIRAAYLRAFQEDKNIEAAINDKSFLALSLIRNILVHKAGQVDKEFVRRGAGIDILKPVCAMGHGPIIFIDGEMVRDLLNPAITCAVAVIKVVNEWLIANPEK